MITIHSFILILIFFLLTFIVSFIIQFFSEKLLKIKYSPSIFIKIPIFSLVPYLIVYYYFRLLDVNFSLIPVIVIHSLFGIGALSIVFTGKGRYPQKRIKSEVGALIGIIIFWLYYLIIK